jgi:hypothetical protein
MVFVAEDAARCRVGCAVGLLTGGLTGRILFGSLMATGVNLALSQTHISGGVWRLPFLVGRVFGFIAMVLRRWLHETPCSNGCACTRHSPGTTATGGF